MDKIKKELLKKRAKEIVNRDFLQEIMAAEILNESKTLDLTSSRIAQLVIGGIDIQIWKDGNKYRLVKEILPHAKTAERDSVESMTKEAAIEKMINLIKGAFK